MLSDKELKKEFRKVVSKDPEKYFPVSYLRQEGFKRKECRSCGRFFWSKGGASNVCGDANCCGGFSFIGDSPAKKKLSYSDVWKEFSLLFRKNAYAAIDRYPVVARWNPTSDFTIASISAFQPFVVSGEVKPPANPLVLPQFCLRFGDTDNVGVTGSHMTGFVMIGQHGFFKKSDWDQNKVFSHIHEWLNKGLGLDDSEIIFHEDAWAGGGNFGSCIEFFSRGIEIGNQVYMYYEQTPKGNKELPIKVLDMGMGQERCAWFSQGEGTIYDATFPKVMKSLYDSSGFELDKEFMRKYVPLAGCLDIDECKDLNLAWKSIANKLGMNVFELKKKVLPLSALYSLGEHTRSLLVALNDGGLPSNVGGGYNLRMLARRCFDFIDKYKLKIYLPDLCAKHSGELKEQYPELTKNLDDVRKILDVEKKKYIANKQKAEHIVQKIVLDKSKINTKKLIELYDSNGIAPEVVREEMKKVGVDVEVPDNFYSLVAERHENKVQEHQTSKYEVLDLTELPETRILYYDNYKLEDFSAKVLKVIGDKVILDQTLFYPTSGGQLHDVGKINNMDVVDVFKQGNVVVHVMGSSHGLREGDKVSCLVDLKRRVQLAQHHTATHIVNAAARRVLGNHVNQAGAKKTLDKAHIDITHYQSLGEDELKNIEEEANEIIEQGIIVKKSVMSREGAEKEYGFSIYQGGVPIGDRLRIVDIVGVDVEACGGTHVDSTKEVERIKILKSTKVSDSIVRIEFVAGKKVFEEESKEKEIIDELSKLLDCSDKEVPGRLQELFVIWKKAVKKKKHVDEFELKCKEICDGDIIEKSAEILKTQPEHLVNTVNRFLSEIKDCLGK